MGDTRIHISFISSSNVDKDKPKKYEILHFEVNKPQIKTFAD